MSTIREMTWRDIPALAALEQELFAQDAWTEATWWAELAERPRRAYLVIESSEGSETFGEIEGYAGLDQAGEVADVMTVAVIPARRGRGLGDRLVGELMSRAAASGARAAMLEVRADNAPARALYGRHGFEEVSVRRRYYQPDGIDAVVMRARVDG